jgi:hypothetical protein
MAGKQHSMAEKHDPMAAGHHHLPEKYLRMAGKQDSMAA